MERSANTTLEKFGLSLTYVLFVISTSTLAIEIGNIYFSIFTILIILSVSVYGYGVYMERIRVINSSTQTNNPPSFIV